MKQFCKKAAALAVLLCSGMLHAWCQTQLCGFNPSSYDSLAAEAAAGAPPEDAID